MFFTRREGRREQGRNRERRGTVSNCLLMSSVAQEISSFLVDAGVCEVTKTRGMTHPGHPPLPLLFPSGAWRLENTRKHPYMARWSCMQY